MQASTALQRDVLALILERIPRDQASAQRIADLLARGTVAVEVVEGAIRSVFGGRADGSLMRMCVESHPILLWLWGPEPLIMVQQKLGADWEIVFRTVTRLADPPGLALSVLVAYGTYGSQAAAELLTLLLLASGLNALLWRVLAAPRPCEPGIVVRVWPLVSSFPSGHTVTSTIVWGWFASNGYVPRITPLVVVPAVMLSRLYLGVHYLGDVAFSTLVGLAVLGLFGRRSLLAQTLRLFARSKSPQLQ